MAEVIYVYLAHYSDLGVCGKTTGAVVSSKNTGLSKLSAFLAAMAIARLFHEALICWLGHSYSLFLPS